MADIRHLRYFLGIVEHGSLSRAAEALRVAQPALSLHLKKLEAEFGCQLLHRTTRGVVPTESGARLAQKARALLDQIGSLADDVRGVEAVPAGPTVVGIPTSLGTIVTVPLVKRVHELFPDVRLRVVEALSGHMVEWLQSGVVEQAFLFGAEAPTGIDAHFLVREGLCLVGPGGGAASAGLDAIEMDKVLELDLIMPSRPHGVREELERAAQVRRRVPRIIVEMDALDQIKALVADGVGYTILSQRFARHGAMAEHLDIVPIVRPSIERVISLAHAGDRPLSAAARAVRIQVMELMNGLTRFGRWI